MCRRAGRGSAGAAAARTDAVQQGRTVLESVNASFSTLIDDEREQGTVTLLEPTAEVGYANGVASLEEMRTRIAHYRRQPPQSG